MKWTLLIACLLQVSLVRAQSAKPNFGQKIDNAVRTLICIDPDEQNPVSLNTQLVGIEGSDSIAVIVKIRIAPGWHIYAYVPATMPYVATECIVKPDANAKVAGSWEKSTPFATVREHGVLIYENEAVFIQRLTKASNTTTGTINAGLYYQTCNLRQCLPPVEKVMELRY